MLNPTILGLSGHLDLVHKYTSGKDNCVSKSKGVVSLTTIIVGTTVTSLNTSHNPHSGGKHYIYLGI